MDNTCAVRAVTWGQGAGKFPQLLQGQPLKIVLKFWKFSVSFGISTQKYTCFSSHTEMNLGKQTSQKIEFKIIITAVTCLPIFFLFFFGGGGGGHKIIILKYLLTNGLHTCKSVNSQKKGVAHLWVFTVVGR